MPPPDELPPVAGAKLAPDVTCAGTGLAERRAPTRRALLRGARRRRRPRLSSARPPRRALRRHRKASPSPNAPTGARRPTPGRRPAETREEPLPLDEAERAGAEKRREHVRQVEPRRPAPRSTARSCRRRARPARAARRARGAMSCPVSPRPTRRRQTGPGTGTERRPRCPQESRPPAGRRERRPPRWSGSLGRRFLGSKSESRYSRSTADTAQTLLPDTAPDSLRSSRSMSSSSERSRRRSHGRYHGEIRLRQAVPLPGPRLRIVLRGRGRGGGGRRRRRAEVCSPRSCGSGHGRGRGCGDGLAPAT